MKSLLGGLAFGTLGLFALSGNANASCGDSGGGEIDSEFGTSLSVHANDINGGNCSEYVLDPADLNEDLEKSFQATSSGVVPIPGLGDATGSMTVSGIVSIPGFGFVFDSDTTYSGLINPMLGLAEGEIGDTIIFTASPSTSSYSGTFEVCANFSSALPVTSSITTSGMAFSISGGNADIALGFGSVGNDFSVNVPTVPGTGIAPVAAGTFQPTSAGEQCATGTFSVSNIEEGENVEFKLELGGAGATVVQNAPAGGGQANGHFEGRIKFLSVSNGVSCDALSGSASACGDLAVDAPLVINPYKCPNGCETSIGNPINFSLGFKHQTETDYSSGVLSFTRSYRSDADWYSGSVGQRWRHNFDRSVVVNGNQASVVDEAGLIHTFVDDGSGDWVPIADDANRTDAMETVVSGYVLTTQSDTKEHFNNSGRLSRIEYRGGEALNLLYDGLQRLSSVTDENGKSLTFTYTGLETRVSTMSTPEGTYSYGYDGNGNLVTVTTPDTEVMTYHYEDASHVNAMTGMTDERGIRVATYGYDAQGRAVSTEGANGSDKYTVSFNADDTVTTTNPFGKQTTYTFETFKGIRRIVSVEGHQSAHCAAANKAYGYDVNGWLVSKTDWEGNLTTYTRDGRGLVTSMTEAAGAPEARTITYTYDAVYRLPDVITEPGLSTDYNYDVQGRMVSETLTDTNSGESRTTSYTYYADSVDGFGNVVLGRVHTIDGQRTDVTDVTTFEYDANYRLTKTTNALGHVTEVTEYDSADRVVRSLDGNGVETYYTYDAEGRMLTKTEGNNTWPLKNLTWYSYTDDGQLFQSTPSNGAYTRYYYNDQGRVRLTRNITNGQWVFYDNAGNVTLEKRKRIAGGTSDTYSHHTTFDELSRKLTDREEAGHETGYSYDLNSNLIKLVDANNNVTDYAFDGLDRMAGQVDALGGITSYNINALNQTETITDPRSNTTTYTYNAFGDVLTEISPDRGTMTYIYDEAGNVISMSDARGEVVTYTYDALNRVSSVSYTSDSSLNQSFTYDAVSGCGSSIGRLCSVSDASGTTDYIYDALGRLTDVTETRASVSFTTSYAYDLAGVLTGITLPSGRVITYGLDVDAQVESVTADVNGSATTIANNIMYQPFGPLLSLDYGNGVSLSNSYDLEYRLTARNIGSLFNQSYTHDPIGNITATSDDSYTYDALYRLIGENSDSYTYDAIANRLTGKGVTYIYPSDSSRLSDIGVVSVTTDAAGNITQDVTRSYVIDAAGHVETVSVGGSVVGSYVYDANNQRAYKNAGGTVTHYVYGKNGFLYGEYDAAGNVIREYVYLNGEPIAQIDGGALPSGETLAYLHTDHLGTPRVASNDSGVSVWSWDSDAFGNGTPSGSATVNLRFTGQYWDDESGLHYNWNRYYDPQTGRYVSSDPIGLDGGLNTFAYVEANPVLNFDPRGLAIWYGRMRTLGAGGLAQASWSTLWLHTNDDLSNLDLPCIDIRVDLLGGGVGIGGRVERTYDYIRINTGRNNFNIKALEGHWTFAGGGVRGKDRGKSYGVLSINGYRVATLEDYRADNVQLSAGSVSGGASKVTVLGRKNHNPID